MEERLIKILYLLGVFLWVGTGMILLDIGFYVFFGWTITFTLIDRMIK